MVSGGKVSAMQTETLHLSSQKIGSLKLSSLKKATSKKIQKKSKMVPEQDTIMQAIARAANGAARVVVQAMAIVRTDRNDRMQNAVPKIGRAIMRKCTFNGEEEDKYSELKNFIQEVNNIFESYNTVQAVEIAITKTGYAERAYNP